MYVLGKKAAPIFSVKRPIAKVSAMQLPMAQIVANLINLMTFFSVKFDFDSEDIGQKEGGRNLLVGS